MTGKTKKSVLFVDDNTDATDLFTAAAEIAGVNPTVCNDSTEALKFLEAEEFDAVILDLSMPVLDGLTLAEEIRRNEEINPAKRPVCIIFYTARNIDGAIQRVAQRVGVQKIYQKGSGMDLLDILMEVKTICGGRQMFVAKHEEKGAANANWLICLIAVIAQILTVSLFLWLRNKEDVAAAYEFTKMKSQRDQIKNNCDDNALISSQKDVFISQSNLQLPPNLSGQKPCTSASGEK